MRIRLCYHCSVAPFCHWTVALFHFPVSSEELAQNRAFVRVRGTEQTPDSL